MIAWLTDTALYTAALIALVLVLRRPVARQFGPQTAYLLWALPFLRLLLPPIVLPAAFAPQVTQQTTVTTVELVNHARPVEMLATAPAAPVMDWSEAVLPLWLAGAAVFLAWRIVTYRRMRREVLADARPVGDVGKVRLIESPAVASPVAFGVTDKVVALPLLFMAQPDRARRDLAIAHELAHHRGNDLLANLAAQALLALHWYNPLAWMGWRAMRRDQEAACDARVMAGRGLEDRVRYARLIATIAAGSQAQQFRALAAPMACPVLGEASIIHRLRSLSMAEPSRRRRWAGRSVVAAAALALPLTASISYAAAEEQAETAPTAPQMRKRIVIVDRAAAAEGGAAPVGAAPFTHTVERADGTTVVLKTDRELTEAEVQQRVDMALAQLPPAPPAPPAPPLPPVAGAEPPAPPAPPAPPQVRQFVLRGDAAPRSAANRQVIIRRNGGEPFDEQAFEAQMEQMERDLERQFASQDRANTQVHRFAMMGAGADAPRVNVVTRCDGRGPARTQNNADGSQTVFVCHAEARATALSALKTARSAVASASIPEEARAEALREIDSEIARMDH